MNQNIINMEIFMFGKKVHMFTSL